MPPYHIEWLEEAGADVRALDRATAMHLFEGILRFSRTGSGDMRIFGVRHRSEAYR